MPTFGRRRGSASQKQGIRYDIMTELLARYLINHPEKRDQHGFMLLTDALAVAYPCKEQHQ